MRTHRLGWTIVAAMTCLWGAACRNGGAARIEVARRDIVLYGDLPYYLPVRVIDGAGKVRWFRDVELRLSSRSAMHLIPDAGAVICDRAGTATVVVKSGSLADSLSITCRPISGFRGLRTVDMTLGDPPQPLRLEAVFPSGDSALMHPISMTVQDERVARMTGDSIVAVGLGRTELEVELGGHRVMIGIFVRALLANDTLALRAGQFHNWILDPGAYKLTVAPVAPEKDRRWLELVTDGARCARNNRIEDTVNCVVYKSGAVIVRNVAFNDAGVARRAFVRIEQMP